MRRSGAYDRRSVRPPPPVAGSHCDAIQYLAGEVEYTEDPPVAVPGRCPRRVRCTPERHGAGVGIRPHLNDPAVTARLAAGARLISAPESSRGERLVDAVAMMDKLRTAGPWKSEQTHDSLRKYLWEETYELLDAVRSGNADQLREELGDLLLQVLFHSRIAEDAPHDSEVHRRRRRGHADAKARYRGAGSACGQDDYA